MRVIALTAEELRKMTEVIAERDRAKVFGEASAPYEAAQLALENLTIELGAIYGPSRFLNMPWPPRFPWLSDDGLYLIA